MINGRCISTELAPRSGNGACIMFTSPSDELLYYSFRLEFEATNNVVEYEALLLGLNIAKDLGIKILHIIGDSDLIVCQVKGHHACKHERLKRYRLQFF
jgi:ribonuclease HI